VIEQWRQMIPTLLTKIESVLVVGSVTLELVDQHGFNTEISWSKEVWTKSGDCQFGSLFGYIEREKCLATKKQTKMTKLNYISSHNRSSQFPTQPTLAKGDSVTRAVNRSAPSCNHPTGVFVMGKPPGWSWRTGA
jgi:hypothetical protein